MPFVLHPFAAVKDGYVTRFISDEADVRKGEIALPVIADADPVLADGQRIWGPDFEVLPDRVRAYGRAAALEGEEYLLNRIAKLEAALDARLAVVESKTRAV